MKDKLVKLVESELQKSEIVMGTRSEIVDKLQRDAEKIGNMKIDILGPLVTKVKAEYGVAKAEEFNRNVGEYLDQALTVIMDIKDKIDTETLKLSGDIDHTNDLGMDLGMDEDVPEMDFGDTFGDDDGLEAELDAEVESEVMPVGREEKMESVQKIGIVVESINGNIGKKMFNNKEEFAEWKKLHESKIKRVVKIIKG